VAVKEAVVAGVPVVGTQVGGIPDYVFPEKNGVLCAAGDVTAFAEAIRRACRHPLLGQGRVDAATLGQVREYLSPKRMAEGFRDIYRRLASGAF
jgi:glycosyltransferase involved in cell wall biosynthesis